MKKIFTVYDRYIFTQVLITTIVAILLFTIVWIAPEMLLNTIKKVLAHEYTVKTGILVLVYELPKILGKAFPVGLLLGSLFTFDKLSKDSELTIFRAVGMSFHRILAPVLVTLPVCSQCVVVVVPLIQCILPEEVLLVEGACPHANLVQLAAETFSDDAAQLIGSQRCGIEWSVKVACHAGRLIINICVNNALADGNSQLRPRVNQVVSSSDSCRLIASRYYKLPSSGAHLDREIVLTYKGCLGPRRRFEPHLESGFRAFVQLGDGKHRYFSRSIGIADGIVGGLRRHCCHSHCRKGESTS